MHAYYRYNKYFYSGLTLRTGRMRMVMKMKDKDKIWVSTGSLGMRVHTFLQLAHLQRMYHWMLSTYIYISKKISAVINTSNTVIYTSNKNLPEIHPKRPFIHPYLFILPKLHLYIFSLSSKSLLTSSLGVDVGLAVLSVTDRT